MMMMIVVLLMCAYLRAMTYTRLCSLKKWLLLTVSIVTCILGAASAISVFVSMVTTISNDGSSLLMQCDLNGTLITYSITKECPFDPTRIYVSEQHQTPELSSANLLIICSPPPLPSLAQGTTLTLWGLLVSISVVEVVFSAHCFAACTSYLRLPCPWRKTPKKSRVKK